MGDLIYAASWNGGNGYEVWRTAQASFVPADNFVVTYLKPAGGTYNISYSYLTTEKKSNASTYSFKTVSEEKTMSPDGDNSWQPYGLSQDDHDYGYSYSADVVTLSTSVASFDGWYENDVKISTDNPYTYPITKTASVTAKFKYATITAPDAPTITTSSSTEDEGFSLVFDADVLAGDWSVDDFNATLGTVSGSGSFTVLSKSYENNRLTVNLSYNAQGHFDEGSTVTLTVAPTNSSCGNSVDVFIKAMAEPTYTDDAKLIDGATEYTGTLTDMLALANTLNNTPTLMILRNVEITSTMQIKKSMTINLNNKKLSSTTLNNAVLVQGESATDKIELNLVDNSFLNMGSLECTNDINGLVEGIKIADENKVILKGADIVVRNNNTGNDATTYGIHTVSTANLLMPAKTNDIPEATITVTANHNAYGIYAESGYATLQGGTVNATAKNKAYGIYSKGTSNITNAVLTATTNTGDEAYAVDVNGGTTILDGVIATAVSATQEAFGVNVEAGQLFANGGQISASGATGNVYGINVMNGANATIQQLAEITASSTSGNNIYGVYNAGTTHLANIHIMATSTAQYAKAIQTVAGASTTIANGIYTASATMGYAYGLHHQGGTLTIDGGNFTGTAAGDYAFGMLAESNASIANATLSGEATESAKWAYGFKADGSGITATLTNCTIKALSNTSDAYALYSNANVTTNGGLLDAKTMTTASAYGFYANAGENVLNNTNAMVDAYTTDAYGIKYVTGTLSVNGGEFTVKARQSTADKAVDSKVYGVFVADGKMVNLQDATFTVTASNSIFSQNAYGVYTGTGTINSTNCTYTISAAKKSYGLYGATGSTLTLNGNTISSSATASTDAIGIYSNANFSVTEDRISAQAATYDSYPLYFGASAAGVVSSGWFMAEGNSDSKDNIIAPINAAANAANVQVKGGFFNTLVQLRYYVPTGYDIYGVDPAAPERAQGYNYTVNNHIPYDNVCYLTEANIGFPTLEEAFDYARNHSGASYTILMTQPYTLPAGNYMLPANATLVVPYQANQTEAIGDVAKRRVVTTQLIAENRKLTFATGANLDVFGGIEVSAEQYVKNVSDISYVQGPYGRIHLEEGSTITLNSGAKINAWGYITGQGEIRVKDGATVREFFQIMDMKGASDLTSNWLKSSNKVFPINQYYIQNIEAPTKYYYGAQLYGQMGYCTSTSASAFAVPVDDINLVGTDGAFFTVTANDESAWVRKSYNPTTDRMLWETNSSAQLGSLVINISMYNMDSKNYIMPLTNNMDIHALSGLLKVTQSSVFMPGATIELDKAATLQINQKDTKNQAMGLYLYDKNKNTTIKPIVYSPSWSNGKCPRGTKATEDASIYVKGKINVLGSIYTTEGGAAIYSDPTNAGTIDFKANAAADGTLDANLTTSYSVTSAQLRNGGLKGTTFVATKGNAVSGDSYVYADIDGDGTYTWTKLSAEDDCVVADRTDSDNPIYYAKPEGYVAIASNVEDDDHLFHSVEGGRLFIQQTTVAGCQWWEVVATADPAVFECKKPGYEGFYSYNSTAGEWQLVKRNVTFYMDEAKTEATKKVVSVNYMGVPDQSVISTNPSKATTVAATYTFYGWKSNVTETEYPWTATLEPAAADMFYTPVFTETPRNYTITLNDANNGADVKVETPYGELPSYTPTKATTAQYTYNFVSWSPALVAVTGSATYTANWDAVVNLYTITWKDGDNTLQTDKNQKYGNITAFNGTLPTKDADDEFVYVFDGWVSSQNGTKYNDGSTPAVSGDVIYTAHYATTPRYMISFVNYNGEVLQMTPVTQGEVPVFNGTPRREPDRDGYFRFTGWKNNNGDFYAASATLPTAAQNETYTSQWEYVTTVFTVTFNNFDGNDGTWSNSFGEGETPSYDGATSLGKAATIDKEYTLDYWLAVSNSEHYNNPLPAVTKDETYTAMWAESVRQYTITWVDGNGKTLKEEQVAYGTTPAYTGATPTKAATDTKEYTFNNNWSPAIVEVNGDATYTAQFDESDIKYDITWIDGNGAILYAERVAAGEIPSYDETTYGVPAKTSTTIYDYTFNNSWSPAIAPATSDAVYRAQFDAIEIIYTITFKDENGSTLKTQSLHYGDQPSCDQPEREVTDLITHIFNGWKLNNEGTASKTIPAVTANATYWANFTVQNNVALVNGTGYGTWADAWTAANATANSTLKLLADINGITSAQTFTQNLTLDLNGHAINGSISETSSGIFTATTAVTMTIDDSQTGGVIKNEASYNGTVCVVYLGRSGSYNNYKYAKLIINGGTLIAKNTVTSGNSRAAYTVYLQNSASSNVTVNGGELQASNNRMAYNINRQNNGTATITGGKFLAEGATTNCYNFSATVSNVEGGYFSHSKNVTAKSDKTLLTLADNHPEKANGYGYVVETAHSITWNANGGTIPTSPAYTSGQVASGTPIVAPTVEKQGYTFDRWTPEVADAMPTDANLSYTAQWEIIPEVTTHTEITGETETDNLIITTTGSVEVANTGSLTVGNLIIEANAGESGELIIRNSESVTATNIYFDYMFNGAAFNRAKQNWYAFAVPFEVDPTQLQYKKPNGSFAACGLGKAIDIIYYNGQIRAENGTGKNAWEYVEDLSDKTLKPGTLYLAAFSKDEYAAVVRFPKKENAPLIASNMVPTWEHASATTTDANWNGVANPNLYYSTLSESGVSVGQIYEWSDDDESNYKTVPLTEALSVGKPIFIQATTGTAIADEANRPAALAPARRLTAAKSDLVDVRISAEGNNKYSDRLFVAANEEATNEYTIGADVVKAGIATKRPQMWVENYGQKLCLNTIAPVANKAEYILGISVPNNGTYTIEQASSNEGTLYLTQNGNAIWNLSDAPYTVSLNAGTTNIYGLRWVFTAQNVVTDINEAGANARQDVTQKLIYNEHLLMINSGNVYDAQGAKLK